LITWNTRIRKPIKPINPIMTTGSPKGPRDSEMDMIKYIVSSRDRDIEDPMSDEIPKIAFRNTERTYRRPFSSWEMNEFETAVAQYAGFR
jgi:hypothetical protein